MTSTRQSYRSLIAEMVAGKKQVTDLGELCKDDGVDLTEDHERPFVEALCDHVAARAASADWLLWAPGTENPPIRRSVRLWTLSQREPRDEPFRIQQFIQLSYSSPAQVGSSDEPIALSVDDHTATVGLDRCHSKLIYETKRPVVFIHDRNASKRRTVSGEQVAFTDGSYCGAFKDKRIRSWCAVPLVEAVTEGYEPVGQISIDLGGEENTESLLDRLDKGDFPWRELNHLSMIGAIGIRCIRDRQAKSLVCALQSRLQGKELDSAKLPVAELRSRLTEPLETLGRWVLGPTTNGYSVLRLANAEQTALLHFMQLPLGRSPIRQFAIRRLGQGISGLVLKHRRRLVINNLFRLDLPDDDKAGQLVTAIPPDPVVPPGYCPKAQAGDWMSGRAIACVPLGAADDVLGTITIVADRPLAFNGRIGYLEKGAEVLAGFLANMLLRLARPQHEDQARALLPSACELLTSNDERRRQAACLLLTAVTMGDGGYGFSRAFAFADNPITGRLDPLFALGPTSQEEAGLEQPRLSRREVMVAFNSRRGDFEGPIWQRLHETHPNGMPLPEGSLIARLRQKALIRRHWTTDPELGDFVLDGQRFAELGANDPLRSLLGTDDEDFSLVVAGIPIGRDVPLLWLVMADGFGRKPANRPEPVSLQFALLDLLSCISCWPRDADLPSSNEDHPRLLVCVDGWVAIANQAYHRCFQRSMGGFGVAHLEAEWPELYRLTRMALGGATLMAESIAVPTTFGHKSKLQSVDVLVKPYPQERAGLAVPYAALVELRDARVRDARTRGDKATIAALWSAKESDRMTAMPREVDELLAKLGDLSRIRIDDALAGSFRSALNATMNNPSAGSWETRPLEVRSSLRHRAVTATSSFRWHLKVGKEIHDQIRDQRVTNGVISGTASRSLQASDMTVLYSAELDEKRLEEVTRVIRQHLTLVDRPEIDLPGAVPDIEPVTTPRTGLRVVVKTPEPDSTDEEIQPWVCRLAYAFPLPAKGLEQLHRLVGERSGALPLCLSAILSGHQFLLSTRAQLAEERSPERTRCLIESLGNCLALSSQIPLPEDSLQSAVERMAKLFGDAQRQVQGFVASHTQDVRIGGLDEVMHDIAQWVGADFAELWRREPLADLPRIQPVQHGVCFLRPHEALFACLRELQRLDQAIPRSLASEDMRSLIQRLVDCAVEAKRRVQPTNLLVSDPFEAWHEAFLTVVGRLKASFLAGTRQEFTSKTMTSAQLHDAMLEYMEAPGLRRQELAVLGALDQILYDVRTEFRPSGVADKEELARGGLVLLQDIANGATSDAEIFTWLRQERESYARSQSQELARS